MAIDWSDAGVLDYADAVEQMQAHRSAMLEDPQLAGRVLLCRHPPTITLGRNARSELILADRETLEFANISIHRTSRGGEVTLHDEGQLMIYPIVRVRSVRRFLATVADAIIAACASFGVDGARWTESPAGVWLGERKLAACGIHIHRRISIHGFALNVETPSKAWQWIVPCGLARENGPIGMADATDAPPNHRALAAALGPTLSRALEDLADR